MTAAAKQDAANGRRLFGTDGIRGTANQHPMTPELALQLGRAVTFVAGRGKKHVPRILIGKDTRISCYMLEQAMAAGICSMGGDVILCGPIPTPAVAHLTGSMRVDAGVVISASHNRYSDNGIKIFATDGFKLADAVEAELNDWDAAIERLQARGATKEQTARDRAEAVIAEIKQVRNRTAERLTALRASSDNAWQQQKNRVTEALDDLERKVRETAAKFH